ncbi:phosphatase PAP2 family protein [Fulvivirga lutea]|uniref:Phosphatase PAP2 family protein n=1 Tax=Fulvivirga lutea TaxID=2810512 RepID=A0A975A1F7_9BACT|nr:phosphatase PAP2 family protein [Fulvivirga lutea]QSE98256.1 phosphatase PAP2 family protein [Fulvivirga lutea]
MVAVTSLGSATAYFFIIPVIGWILYRNDRTWAHSIEAFIILISSFLINLALKFYYGRLRPDESLQLILLREGSLSFPSGHSMTSMAFYGFLIYLVWQYTQSKTKKVFFISALTLLILLIGFSRIYLGAHFPSDVLAGFAAGLIWLLVCISILRSYQFKKLRSH